MITCWCGLYNLRNIYLFFLIWADRNSVIFFFFMFILQRRKLQLIGLVISKSMDLNSYIPLIPYISSSLGQAFSKGYTAHQNISWKLACTFHFTKGRHLCYPLWVWQYELWRQLLKFPGNLNTNEKREDYSGTNSMAFDMGFNWSKKETPRSARKLGKVSLHPRDN